jgi:hypothetical protein
MENKDALLIRKLITLVESTDEKVMNHDTSENNNIEEPLDEQAVMFQDAIKTLARTAKEEKGLWQTIKTEIPAIGNKFKNADDFIKAAEAGKIGAAESASIVKFAVKNSPELAMKIKGLLKLQPEFAEMSKMVFPKGTQMAADVAKMEIAKKTLTQMGIDAKEAEAMIRDAAQQSAGTAKVTTKAVDKAIARRAKDLKGSSSEVSALIKDTKSGTEAASTIKAEISKVKELGPEGVKLASKWEKAGVSIGKYSAKTWDRLKSVKGKMNLKNLILYGLAGWGSYEIIKDLFGSDDKGTSSGVMPDCIANAEGTEIGVTSDGSVMVYTKKDIDSNSTGHGGAKFYANNRVWTMDNAMSGTYGCKGSKVEIVAENLKESVLMEELSDIIVKWDNKNTVVPEPPKKEEKKKTKYTDRNKFPYRFGDRGPIIKEVQICFGFPVNLQTGNFGPKTLKKLQELYSTSEINEDTYNKIKEKCKSTSTTDTKTDTKTDTTTTDTKKPVTPDVKPIENTKPVSDTTASTTQPPSSPKTESGGELYARLNAEGLLGPRKFQKSVIVYKGEDLSKEELDKLTTYLGTRGFRLSRDNKDKRFGEKIVFKKNKPTEETGNTTTK